MINHCTNGHQIESAEKGTEFTVTVYGLATKEALHTIAAADGYEQEDIRERLEAGECPICNEWEYIQ